MASISTWTPARTGTCTRSGPNWWRWPGTRPAAAYGPDFAGPATVLVGDTPLDVAAALATGARAVAVATGSYPAADLAAAGAHVVLPDLTDTARVVAAVTAGRAGGVTRSVDTGGRRPGPGRSSGASSSAGRAARRRPPAPH